LAKRTQPRFGRMDPDLWDGVWRVAGPDLCPERAEPEIRTNPSAAETAALVDRPETTVEPAGRTPTDSLDRHRTTIAYRFRSLAAQGER
jgi:hypothetical protein